MQAFQSCLLSLFEQKEKQKDVRGAVAWLKLAYADYHDRVINHQISYDVFVEEFHARVCAGIFTDGAETIQDIAAESIARDKVCRILDKRLLTESFFCKDGFDDSDASKMLHQYNIQGTAAFNTQAKKASPIADLPHDIQCQIVAVLNRNGLFSPSITSEDFLAFLSTGKPSKPYSSCSNTDLAFAIVCLRRLGMVNSRWASTICRHGLLLTEKGLPMEKSNIGNTAGKFKDYKPHHLTSKQKRMDSELNMVIKSYFAVISDSEK